MATAIEDMQDEHEDDLPPEDEQEGADDAATDDGDDQPDDDSDEDEIVVGEERANPEEESEGVRNLRKRLRELEKENRTLKAPAKVEQLKEPDPDDYWDRPEDFKQALRAYDAQQRDAEQAEEQQRTEADRAQKLWTRQYDQFEESWQGLRVAGKDTARSKVEEVFDAQQQALLVKAARGNAAGLFVHLGSNTERLDKLKALRGDPAEFVAEAAIMANEVKVQRRRPATEPEAQFRGSGGAQRSNSTLERLEKEAERSGDRSALIKYRSQMSK